MTDSPKKKLDEPIELGKVCRVYLDPKTQSVKAVCPPEIIDAAAAVKPRRIVFELETKEE